MTDILTRGAYALPSTSLNFKTGTWRVDMPVHKHWSAPCHAACPAGEDQQAWLAKMQEGRNKEAWETLVSANPMPAVTGRVCPHPCESACNRGQYDQPIAIHNVERFLGDEAIAKGWSYPLAARPSADAPQVAVIGAGPAGISAAYHLLRQGLKPVLFDALPEPGGLLRSAIPMTRLPREVIDAEIGRILDLGIDFRPRQRLGRDYSLSELQKDYAAVFLGLGAQKSRAWDVDGATPDDLKEALHLLKDWVDHGAVPKATSVAIHGGGNTAVDLARVMKRHGSKQVYVVTASGLPGPDTAPDDVLNVVPRELDEAIEEGVEFLPHRTIQRLIMRGSKVTGLETVSLKKLPRASGRKGRVSFEGTERVLEVDMVIPAIGEIVDPQGIETLLGKESHLWAEDDFGRIKKHDGVFVGGDARGDRGTVSAAVGDGRLAARAIAAFVVGETTERDVRDKVEFDKLNLAYYEPADRVQVNILPVAKRTDTTEIEGALTQSEADREAKRCFSCGNCLACDNCWTLCPDNAVVKTREICSDGSHYVFDYEFCKGCGLCAHECPCGFIQMKTE